MKRHGQLWAPLLAWENLLRAAHKARRGKRHHGDVQRFHFDEEWELLRLQAELRDGSYRPGPFRTHTVQRPKPRLISAAPFRDRVVHHAVLNRLEPIFDRHFHPDSFACRKGKGTHAAATRLQQHMRRSRFLLASDVRKFFPSIDHAVLKGLYRRLLKDRRVLELLDLIVDHANEQEPVHEWFPGDDLWTPQQRRRGLPIGNLTSQWLANLYLNDLDHFVTSHLGIGGFVRYCDDFILLDRDRGRLKQARAAVTDFLASRRLRLHEERSSIVPVRAGVTFVGYRIWSHHRYLPKDNIRQFRRRVRWMKQEYAAGRITLAEIQQRIASWSGHARQANSVGLIERLSTEWVFQKGPASGGR